MINKLYTFGRNQSSKTDYKEIIDRKEWINFGENNDFPQELIRLYHSASPLHTALINKKTQMLAGNGLILPENQTLTERLFYMNRYSNDNLDEIIRKISFDLFIFNGFYLNIIWNENGDKIARIEHIPYDKVRVSKNMINGEISGYYVSRDWLDYRKAINKPVFYPIFNEELAKISEEKSQILGFNVYTPGMDYYTLPSYVSSLDSIKANYELNLFHLNSIQNGFLSGMIIINKGEYTEEEQYDIYNDIKKKFTGSDNAGEFIMMFVPDESMVPEIKPIELQATDQRYLDLKSAIIEDIIQGHMSNSAVAGREVSGKLGTSNEIIEGHDLFNKTVINPYKKIIEDIINKLALINGIDYEYKLSPYDYFSDIINIINENKNK